MYSFRAWLNDDSNQAFVADKEKELLLEEIVKKEDWLDLDGSDAGSKIYVDLSKQIKVKFDLVAKRKKDY